MFLENKILATSVACLLALSVGCASNKGGESGAESAPAVAEAPAAPQPQEPAQMKATLGQVAPNFTLQDVEGKSVSLADFRGKTVVLEWFNPGCPFVKYAHGEGGPLEMRPSTWVEKGVTWIAINSGGKGKEGADMGQNQKASMSWGMSYPVLMDGSGRVGKMYGAKSTPHMFVINGDGVLVYQGALDNAPLGNLSGDVAVNYVDEALEALTAGEAVAQANTKPYGCSVKYAN